MELLDSPPPRKRKKKTNNLDSDPQFKALVSFILSGTLKPGEGKCLRFLPSDTTRLKMKNPARAAETRVRHLLRDINMEADYELKRYLDANENWVIDVSYMPREAALSANVIRRVNHSEFRPSA